MAKNQLNQLTINQAQAGLKKKRFSAVELTGACLERIKKVDGQLKAFITVSKEEALAQAKKADILIRQNKDAFKEKPLLGVPVAVKDNFSTEGIRTTAGSKLLENYRPVFDATVVKRLKAAGAVIIGKTNMDAWAHGSSTETSAFFTTKNPWNLNYLPGGSSGGSAAAIAGHQTICSIGSETAGSIRQPASWCGVTGFKPTYGRVSRSGLIAMASSTDSPGPISKTITDAYQVLKVLAGKDQQDATSLDQELPDSPSLLNDLSGVKIGIPQEYFLKDMDQETVDLVKRAISFFEKHQAEIIKVSLIDPQYSVAVYTIIQRSEVSSNLARFDGIRYGHSRKAFQAEAKRRIMLGSYALSSGYYDQYYLKAQKVRQLIIKDFADKFNQVDLLLSSTTPTPALKLGASEKSPMFGELQDILVEASSLAGLPGVSLPCGFTSQGLPVGMQLIGPQLSEPLLFKVGRFYQQQTDWHKQQPEIKTKGQE